MSGGNEMQPKKILAVFPGDCLKTFYEKGEIKERYYNPGDFFDEVHFFTFCDDEVEPAKVRKLVGKARIFIHPLGSLNLLSIFTSKSVVLEEVKKANPSAIRAFTPSVHGFFAAYCANELKIPFVISIHGDFDRDVRYFYWKTWQLKNWLQSTYMQLLTERYAIASADKVICAYSFPIPYAKAYGAKSVEVIYNKVYAERFDKAKPALALDAPAVICVGRMIPEKNQECLVRAFALLKERNVKAKLVLIGNGPSYYPLVSLAKQLGVEKDVLFFKSVPNEEIPSYYKSARIFALPIKYGGVAIPVIEAMAAGLPVIVAKPELDPHPELASEVGLVVSNAPEAFADSIEKLLKDDRLYEELKRKGLRKFKEIEGRKMEEREAKIYERLLKAGK